MSHYLFLVLFSFLAFNVLDAQAQPPKTVGTNTVGSNPKISSVSIKDANYPEPVKNPKTNLLVFNTNSKIVNGSGEGFYFWNGIKWLPFAKIDLAVTKKMYVDEVTEISTTAARNIIKVEETRRKQIADDQKKQIAANNAALEKERLDKMAAKTIMTDNTSEDELDDLAGDMEDEYKEDLSDLHEGELEEIDNSIPSLEDDDKGNDDDADLQNIDDDADDNKEKGEEKPADDGDPDTDDLVKARKSNADTLATKAIAKVETASSNGPGEFVASMNGKEGAVVSKQVSVSSSQTEIPVVEEAKSEVVANNNTPKEENSQKKENKVIVKEEKEEVVAKKEAKEGADLTKSVAKVEVPAESEKKKEVAANENAEKPVIVAEKQEKKAEVAETSKKEEANLIQNEPENQNTNFMLGKNALAVNENGINNTAVGHQALMGNKLGSENTAIGESALQNNVSGNRNIGIGYNSLYSNAFASYNTAVGVNTLQNYSYDNNASIFNSYNTAFGYAVLMHTNSTNLETGMDNTGVGAEALMANTQGRGNTGVGRLSLRNNTRGNFNTALGFEALNLNTVGVCNTAFGNGALKYIITGEYNTAVGNNAGPIAANHALENTTAIGYAAVTDADNQVRIGNNAVTSIGGYVGWTNLSDGRFKQNVAEDVKGLDFIMQLRPVTYTLNMNALNAHLYGAQAAEILNNSNLGELSAAKSQVRYTGFIAQEVESAAKNTHFEFSGVDAPQNENGHYGLRYAEFTVPLVKAVQEQQQIIADLQAKIANLEKQNQEFAALAKEMEKLKAQMGMMGAINTSANVSNKR